MKNNYTIITGGGGFLAYYFAEAILEEKKNLYLVDINSVNLKKNKNKLEKVFNTEVKTDFVDVTNLDSIKKFIKKNRNIFFDNLINNASKDFKVGKKIGSNFKDLSDITLKEWNQGIDSNLTSYFLVSKEFGKIMKKNNYGNIINISSELSVIAPDHRIYNNGKKIKYYKPVTYSVCKHGIVGLTKYIASSWSNHNIRCNSISPGSVYHKNHNKFFLKEVSKRIPLSRLANPKELKDSIKFLISKNNSFYTGQNMVIDGGRSII
jgi:NAD(P)-dependent dehydrogenase (short-subunit alcohol dehydrogenase family)